MNYILLKVVKTNEDIDKSIPSDQILIDNINLKYALYLKRGEYTIRKFDKNGNAGKSVKAKIE